MLAIAESKREAAWPKTFPRPGKTASESFFKVLSRMEGAMLGCTGRLLSHEFDRRMIAAAEKVFPLFRCPGEIVFPLQTLGETAIRDKLSRIFRDKRGILPNIGKIKGNLPRKERKPEPKRRRALAIFEP